MEVRYRRRSVREAILLLNSVLKIKCSQVKCEQSCPDCRCCSGNMWTCNYILLFLLVCCFLGHSLENNIASLWVFQDPNQRKQSALSPVATWEAPPHSFLFKITCWKPVILPRNQGPYQPPLATSSATLPPPEQDRCVPSSSGHEQLPGLSFSLSRVPFLSRDMARRPSQLLAPHSCTSQRLECEKWICAL